VAAVALSPMGVNGFGLFDTDVSWPGDADAREHSWVGLSQIPVLSVTGDGDNSCEPGRFVCGGGDSGGERDTAFVRMPPGDKYLMYVGDRNTPAIVSSHKRFGSLEGAPCPGGRGPQCATTTRWIESTVIAFLDAYVRDLPAARTWLQSNNLVQASRGVATLQRK
jgi:hypothetical protein